MVTLKWTGNVQKSSWGNETLQLRSCGCVSSCMRRGRPRTCCTENLVSVGLVIVVVVVVVPARWGGRWGQVGRMEDRCHSRGSRWGRGWAAGSHWWAGVSDSPRSCAGCCRWWSPSCCWGSRCCPPSAALQGERHRHNVEFIRWSVWNYNRPGWALKLYSFLWLLNQASRFKCSGSCWYGLKSKRLPCFILTYRETSCFIIFEMVNRGFRQTKQSAWIITSI